MQSTLRKPFNTRTNVFKISICFAIVSILSFTSCSITNRVIGTATGDVSPEIIAKSSDGTDISLSGLKGSYVLIEFWESGNSAARANHFEMQRLYQKYKSAEFEKGNGFCIYSLSLDTDKSKWANAIAQDKITWPCQALDTRSWNASAAINYQVGFLPQYFLIDGNGVIVKKNILIKDLDSIIKENLDNRSSSL